MHHHGRVVSVPITVGAEFAAGWCQQAGRLPDEPLGPAGDLRSCKRFALARRLAEASVEPDRPTSHALDRFHAIVRNAIEAADADGTANAVCRRIGSDVDRRLSIAVGPQGLV